ncbi:MAG: hypothetical protein D5R97_02555 [Candidatus Syntrophonatronum acetioxidans]|uniref:Integrase catalytic domain-containing protein n=1 Tax=Candidatus Syntrophonatronum acetioxidans TaxID=1795816 RepID=A0A424YH27_9FIRM|nr:MAG: hypothetical protein D5R97_02555 [Candidatus Syntrophonatronum acetioxidans]
MGITVVHTQPFDAASKGKIERFFGNIKSRFLPLFRQVEIEDLEGLNKYFHEWLEKEYHRKEHSALGMTPLDKYLSQVSQLKMVEDPAALKPIFLKRDNRKVRHDGTVSLMTRLFEVPPQFIGQKVELRFDEELREVYVFHENKEVALARPVNMADNARVKRDKSHISFSRLEGDENV